MPLLEHLRAEHPGVMLGFLDEQGDLYTFHSPDAEKISEILEIPISGSTISLPRNSIEKPLSRLIMEGLKIALCDPMEMDAG